MATKRRIVRFGGFAVPIGPGWGMVLTALDSDGFAWVMPSGPDGFWRKVPPLPDVGAEEETEGESRGEGR